MNYNERGLKRLLRRIGMEIPLGYLIEGKGAEEIYSSLRRKGGGRVIERGDYSVVAEVIREIVDSEEFRKGAKPGKWKDREGKVRTIFSEIGREDLSEEEVEIFKRFYGIGYEERETYESLLERWLGMKGPAKTLMTLLFPECVKGKERGLRNVVDRMVKILRDKYIQEIYSAVHERLREL